MTGATFGYFNYIENKNYCFAFKIFISLKLFIFRSELLFN